MVLLDRFKSAIWTTNIASNIFNSTIGVILDTGNFVLALASNTTNFLWQSFDEPTNVYLPGAKLGKNKDTGHTTQIVSWERPVDPSPGYYTLALETDPDGNSQIISRWNNSDIYWSSGKWTGSMFTAFPEMASYPKDVLTYEFVVNDQESYFRYQTNETTTTAMLFMEASGQLMGIAWLEDVQDWVPPFAMPMLCNVYRLCGSFAMCIENAPGFCSCLRGFSKRYEGSWLYGNPRGGCNRNARLQCGANSSRNAEADGFYALAVARLPDRAWSAVVTTADACRQACLNNCSCVAYFYDNNRCSLWYGDLINLVAPTYNSPGHNTIHVRLAASEFFSGSSKKSKLLPVLALTGGAAFITVILIVGVFLILKNGIYRRMKKVEGSLVAFEYRYLRSATKNFSERIGKGSFGSVYKGMLPDGTPIAVKKLEGLSQGEKQFRAEISTIGNNQHVSLIRLLGFCSKSSVKMLVCEYMPNGSLANLFGSTPLTLSWHVRFQIALGIAKGSSYMHEECRSCIIHCDIKPENVLLDASFMPKIADFGLAKLVGRDFSRVLTTMRGTVGYLAPEWMSGTAITSKADVFSYGMMLFEIVSGNRNSA
ncbi:hypothetical protein EJB05_53393, partial [Eragrostis curvula]